MYVPLTPDLFLFLWVSADPLSLVRLLWRPEAGSNPRESDYAGLRTPFPKDVQKDPARTVERTQRGARRGLLLSRVNNYRNARP